MNIDYEKLRRVAEDKTLEVLLRHGPVLYDMDLGGDMSRTSCCYCGVEFSLNPKPSDVKVTHKRECLLRWIEEADYEGVARAVIEASGLLEHIKRLEEWKLKTKVYTFSTTINLPEGHGSSFDAEFIARQGSYYSGSWYPVFTSEKKAMDALAFLGVDGNKLSIAELNVE